MFNWITIIEMETETKVYLTESKFFMVSFNKEHVIVHSMMPKFTEDNQMDLTPESDEDYEEPILEEKFVKMMKFNDNFLFNLHGSLYLYVGNFIKLFRSDCNIINFIMIEWDGKLCPAYLCEDDIITFINE